MADNPGGAAAGGGDRRREEASPASQVAEPRREGFGASGFLQRFPDPRVSSMVGARYKAMSPARLPIARSPCLTIPPGFSPSALLESPVLLTNIKAEPSPTTGTFSMASIVSNTVTYNTSPSPREASNNTAFDHGSSGDFEFKPHTRSSFSPGLSSLGYLTSADPNQQEHELPAQIHTSHEMESSQSAKDESRVIASHTLTLSVSAEVAVDELEQSKGLDNDLHAPQCDNNGPASLTVFEKSSEDGYNWRKYGQKHVKGCEFPRSYYKCTHPNCQMKKQLERSQDGHITEIVYKGRHDHPKPQPSRRLGPGTILSGQGDEKSDGFSSLISAADKSSSAHGNVSHYIDSNGIQEPSPLSASDDDVEAGGEHPNYGNNVADDDEDPESKRRKMDATCVDATSLGKVNREPRVVVQTISEVDILDDGYRWRKYGQKVVKGNPNPRSYYKCTNAECPVRKHVERASHDPKAVITTYEGKHIHDVPAARNTSHEASAPMNTNATNTLNSRMPTAMSGLLRNCDMRSAPNHYDHLPESNPISLDLGVGITPNTGSTVSGKNQTAETEHNHQMYFHGSDYSKMMMQTIPGMPVSAIYGSSGTGMYGSREDKGEGFSFSTQATNRPPNLYYSNAENMVFGP